MRRHAKWAALAAVAVALAGCSRPPGGEQTGGGQTGGLTLTGSDTMVNLGQAWAEDYNKEPGRASVSVQGGGSGQGIAALINNATQIAQSSREMKEDEIAQAKAKGVTVKEYVVAQDGLSVIVHKDNPVRRLTIPQMSDIFTGKVMNWKQVGGPDLPIVLISREKNSGTHVFFLEHVLRQGKSKGPEQYAPSTKMQTSSNTVVEQVGQTRGAIGYVGLGYTANAPNVMEVAVAASPAGPFVLPSVETVLNKTYPIARPLYFYTNGEPRGTAKTFIDFVLGPRGQQIVEQLEFVPLRKAAPQGP